MAVYRRGKKWWISVKWRKNLYRRATECRTKTEARREMVRWREEIVQGQAVRDTRVPFREFAARYLEEYAKPNKRSWRRDRVAIQSLNEFFGNYRLSDVTPQLIMRYRARRSRQVTNATTNREISIIRKMLNLAVLWGLLPANPTNKGRPLLLPEDNLVDRVLSPDEEETLLGARTEAAYLKDVIGLMLNTGLRPMEALTLQWGNVVFPLNQIVIEATNSKSKRSRRIPLNEEARAILARLSAGRGGGRACLCQWRERPCSVRDVSEVVRGALSPGRDCRPEPLCASLQFWDSVGGCWCAADDDQEPYGS